MRVIRVFVWVLDETKPSVSLLNIFYFSIRLNSQDLIGVEWLQRLDFADLVCSESPHDPEENDKGNFDIEAFAHPFLGEDLLFLLDDLLATSTLAIIFIIEFFIDLSSDHCLNDTVG